MDYINELEKLIHLKRMELNKHIEQYGINDKITLKISKELDTLLNKYKS